jgi:hypothetical protein
MRTAPVAFALLASLGLAAYQSISTRPSPSAPRPATIDIGSVRRLGDALAVRPLDLSTPPGTSLAPDAAPLTRTDVIAPSIVKPASKAPANAATRPSATSARPATRTPARPQSPVRTPTTRKSAANSSFASALSKNYFAATDFGFSEVTRKVNRGKAVRISRR